MWVGLRLRGAPDHQSMTHVIDGNFVKGRQRVIQKDGQEEHQATRTKVFFP